MVKGDTHSAIEYSEELLELNPGNENGMQMTRRIEEREQFRV